MRIPVVPVHSKCRDMNQADSGNERRRHQHFLQFSAEAIATTIQYVRRNQLSCGQAGTARCRALCAYLLWSSL